MAMYELPELEVIRAIIAEKYTGVAITKIQCGAKVITGKKSPFCEQLINTTIWFVERRAGHLVLHLDTGKRLMIYLSDQSSFYGGEAGEKAKGSPDLVLYFGERFMSFSKLEEQAVQLTTVREVEDQLKVCAPDPLDRRFTEVYFREQLSKKRSSLKTFLLDASVVTGIGPVYSDEILYAARLHPARKVNSLNEQEATNLYETIRNMMRSAIADGGVRTEPLYAQDTLTGSYAERLAVYGRDGKFVLDTENEQVELIVVAKQKCYISPLKQLNEQ